MFRVTHGWPFPSIPDPRGPRWAAGRWAIGHAAALTAVVALLLGFLVLPASASPQSTGDRSGDRYVMLVNSAVAGQLDAQKLEQFNRSPYDGLAVAFLDAYDTVAVPSVSEMDAQITNWRKTTRKHVWPWVYLNRLVGANDAETNQWAKVPYFQGIPGADLDGKAGAQKDFLENWRNALRTAKDSAVPGIVCDLEFYNNYEASNPGALARMTAKPSEDVVKQLRQLGERMADIAAAEYPTATIWFLFTGFTRPDYRGIDGKSYYLSATYIVEGMLDRVLRRRLPLRVLSGGEVGLGYCHSSIEELRGSVEKRKAMFAPLLQKYSGILELAGTMTLWSDRSAKKSWVAQGACGDSSAATVEELEPYMELLFRTYRYSWIYGSINGGYFAFQPDIAPRFDAAVARAKAAALRGH